MFRRIIRQLEETERELLELWRDKAQQLAALVMKEVGAGVKVNMGNLLKVDFDNVKIATNRESGQEVRVVYREGN